jgi:hypothetical protein
VKVTLMTQLVPAAKLVPQVFEEIAKSPAFAPVKLIAFAGMLSAASPVFASVTGSGVLVLLWFTAPKLRLDGFALTTAVPPMPETFRVWGPLLALSYIQILAVLVPTSLGVKDTVIVQLEPEGRVDGQLLIDVKSPASVPEIWTLEIMYEALSLFVTIAVIVWLVLPTSCAGKTRLLGDTLIGAAVGTTPAAALK